MFDPEVYGWVVVHSEEWEHQERSNFLYVTKDWGDNWEEFDTSVLYE
jgi:hypothetical protein